MSGILLDTNSAAAYALSDMRDTQAIEKANLAEKLGSFQDYWSPKIVGELNDSFVKLVKLKGEFVWHHHEAEDELFMVIKGTLLMKLRDREIQVQEGELRSDLTRGPSREGRPPPYFPPRRTAVGGLAFL